MNEQNYTSLKLSKFLEENGFEGESDWCWIYANFKGDQWVWVLVDNKCLAKEKVPAYDIANDLLIKYAKEMFGEKELRGYSNLMSSNPDITKIIPAYKFHTQVVLDFLQQGKKQEAEDYFWNHCLFNKRNKD